MSLGKFIMQDIYTYLLKQVGPHQFQKKFDTIVFEVHPMGPYILINVLKF